MPYGFKVSKTMALAEKFAKSFRSVSVVPEINVSGLPHGLLSRTTYEPDPKMEGDTSKPKKKRKRKKKKGKGPKKPEQKP